MRFGVFSDDEAGPITASAIASGLASIDIAADLVEEIAPRPYGCAGDGSRQEAAQADRYVGGSTCRGAERADGRDIVFALPLDMLAERGVRGTLDVVLTVGRDRDASARALRAARYDAGNEANASAGPWRSCDAPPWFLPWSGQDDLRTKATLSASGPLRLPFATRTVPLTMPRLDLIGRPEVYFDDLSPAALRVAVMLTALVVTIAADPHAPKVEAGTLGELMAARALDREREVSDRLIALCAAFERLEAFAVSPPGATASGGESARWTCRGRQASRRGAGDRPVARLPAFT